MKKLFDNAIEDIINDKKINNISLKNIDIIKYVLNDKNMNKKLYKNFKNNYESIYGDDIECLYMKVEDMIYRCHLLINSVIIDKYGITDKNSIKDAINLYLDSDYCDLFDSVSYDDSDFEFVDNYANDIVDYLIHS